MNPSISPSVRGASWRRLLPSCSVFALIFAAALHGQTGRNGTVAGTISNLATGDLLPGAQITVEGLGITAVSERGGSYSVSLPRSCCRLPRRSASASRRRPSRRTRATTP